MGYRSEVYLGVDNNIVEQLLTFVGTNQEVYRLLFDESEYAKRTKKGGLHFRWDYVKWYDSYDPISKLTDFLNDHDENIKFLRIGESADDVEDHGQFNGMLMLSRVLKSSAPLPSSFSSFIAKYRLWLQTVSHFLKNLPMQALELQCHRSYIILHFSL